MIKLTLKEYILKSIELDTIRLNHYRKVHGRIRINGRLKCRSRRNGRELRYYYVSPDNKETYLGKKKLKTIRNMQQKRLAETMIPIIENNIRLKEWFCEAYTDDDEAAVIETLPRAYRPTEQTGTNGFPQSENPYRRENLVIKTSFGLYVRTKSELQIAELLYSLGIEFYYERALTLWEGTEEFISRTFYPDFTIVRPDGREIYWEHKGMLSNAEYTERDINKEIIYNLNGIYQPHNLIVTAEGPNNEFDMEAVRRMVEGVLLKMMV